MDAMFSIRSLGWAGYFALVGSLWLAPADRSCMAKSTAGPTLTFGQALALLDQAQRQTDASRELELTKGAWRAFEALARRNPQSDFAVRFAARDTIGRLNLNSVQETICLLEPTAGCLFELATGKLSAISVTEKNDPRWQIVSAAAEAGELDRTRAFALTIGPEAADTRRSVFKAITEAEVRLAGAPQAERSLAKISRSQDRAAAESGLVKRQTLVDRARATIDAPAGEFPRYIGERLKKLAEIAGQQVSIGEKTDALETMARATAMSSSLGEGDDPSWSEKMNLLRISAVMACRNGAQEQSRVTLKSLTELVDAFLARQHQYSFYERDARSEAIAYLGVAIADCGDVTAAMVKAREIRNDFQRSKVLIAVIEAALSKGLFTEATGAAQLLVDQFKQEALVYIAGELAKANHRADALEISRGVGDAGKRLGALLQVGAADLQNRRVDLARKVLAEAQGLLATRSASYYDLLNNDLVLGLAFLLAKTGDQAEGQALLDAELERSAGKPGNSYAVAAIVRAQSAMGNYAKARKAVMTNTKPEDYILSISRYLQGLRGCYNEFRVKFGRSCRSGNQFSGGLYFPRRPYAWELT